MVTIFRAWTLIALVSLSFPTNVACASSADSAFEHDFGDRYLDAYWQLHTGYAVYVGYYKVADRLIVPDASARERELQFIASWQRKLHAIDRQQLNASNRADWALLDNDFESARWDLVDAKSWQWDPSQYNVADAFALLSHTEYAPLETRLRTILKRLVNVPAYYAAAKKNIVNPTREHTQLAREQNKGALGVFEELPMLVAKAQLTTAEREQFAKRLGAARVAVNDYIAWLEKLDVQLAQGNPRSFRIGREMYEKKFAYNIQSGDTAQALYQKAVKEKEALHSRMSILADQLWPKYFPNTAPPSDRLEKIGALINKLSEQHVAPDKYFAEVQRLIPELAKWVNDHQLLTLDAAKPLKVRETPVHERGIAMASIDAPGPYDPAAPTYFNVTPFDDMSPARIESFLREYNRWMLPILNIHEAIPGHYAQLVYSNKAASRIKSIFGNGAMVEGWAVYGERAMLESGYGDDTAEMWLIYSKWNLRSVCNTILDYAVHVANMSEADAKRFLTHEAFQSDEEAGGKWRRVQLSSVQLASYFAGYSAIYDFREQRKRDLGSSFDLKRFHEQFLSYGSAPVAIIKELMLASDR